MQKKQQLKRGRGRSVSSSRWLQRHINDDYVQMAKEENYRSRAAFKLLEIDQKFSIIKNAKSIIDLGCAPGSWMEVIKRRNQEASLLGIDLKEIDDMSGAEFLQSDIFNYDLEDQIKKLMDLEAVDLITCDIAPNSSGNRNLDFLRIVSLIERVIEIGNMLLNQNGNLVMKTWRYGDMNKIIANLRTVFTKVTHFKPKCSYNDSAEIFIICLGYKKEQ